MGCETERGLAWLLLKRGEGIVARDSRTLSCGRFGVGGMADDMVRLERASASVARWNWDEDADWVDWRFSWGSASDDDVWVSIILGRWGIILSRWEGEARWDSLVLQLPWPSAT